MDSSSVSVQSGLVATDRPGSGRYPWLIVALLLVLGCSGSEAPVILESTAVSSTYDTLGPYEVISVVIDDQSVDSVFLFYRTSSNPDFVAVEMTHVGGDAYRGSISGQPAGEVVQYYIRATDDDGNEAVDPKYAPLYLYSFVIFQETSPAGPQPDVQAPDGVVDTVDADVTVDVGDTAFDIPPDTDELPDIRRDAEVVADTDQGQEVLDIGEPDIGEPDLRDGADTQLPDTTPDVAEVVQDVQEIDTIFPCVLQVLFPMEGMALTEADDVSTKPGLQIVVQVSDLPFAEVEIRLKGVPGSERKAFTDEFGLATFDEYDVPEGDNVLVAGSPAGCEVEVQFFVTLQEDGDKDGIPDGLDNCPDDYNPQQTDSDGDGMGDACDPDYSCQVDGDCPDPEMRCFYGVCEYVVDCNTSTDCPKNYLCFQGECLPPYLVPSKYCEDDEDCPEKLICQFNLCVPDYCENDLDCLEGEKCLFGECVPDEPTIPDECTDDSDCAADEVCFANLCVPRMCYDDSDCSGGECHQGICIPIPLPVPECETDADCFGFSKCVLGFCVPDLPIIPDGCVDKDDCGPGQDCILGLCMDVQCETADDCDPGENCVFGFCTTEEVPIPSTCDETTPCPDGSTCVFGICVPDNIPIPVPCGPNGECPPGRTCQFGIICL